MKEKQTKNDFLFWFFWENRTWTGLRSQLTWRKAHLLSQHVLVAEHLRVHLVHQRIHLSHHVREEHVALHSGHLQIEIKVSAS